MTSTRAFRAAFLTAVLAALAGQAAARSVLAPPPVYVDFCASCHGPNGEGLDDLGEILVGNAFVRAKTDAELKDFLMTGRHPGSPDSRMDLLMPAFDYLMDDDLDAAVVYLRALAGGATDPDL